MKEEVCPDSLRKPIEPCNVPSRETCRNWIHHYFTTRIENLTALSKRLAQEFDVADRAGARDRALILKDKDKARQLLRYSAESRNAFQRVYVAPLKTLESDKERAEEHESRNEASEQALRSSDSRNEANPAPAEAEVLEVCEGDSGAATASRGAESEANRKYVDSRIIEKV